MTKKKIKERLFFFMLFAIFFLLGGPALAKEGGALSAPVAVLRAESFVYSGEVQYVRLASLSHPL